MRVDLDRRLNSFVLSQIDAMEVRDARNSLGLTLLSMRQLGEFFAGVPGRKTVIWVTGGMPSLRLTVDDLSDAPIVQKQYMAAWDALSRSHVVIYPMDMGGLFNPGFVSPRYSYSSYYRFGMDDSASNLERFAKMTGGKLCIHKMEISDCYRDAQADASHYYLLGYYADVSKLKTGWRHLNVRVLRDGVKVRAREGFFVYPGQKKSVEQDEVLTAVASPVDFTAIPLAVHVDPKGIQPMSAPASVAETSTRQGDSIVPFQFYVPGTAVVVDKLKSNHVDVSFSAFAKDKKGMIRAQFAKRIEGDLSQQALDDLVQKGILFAGDMSLPPGTYNIRFVVRDNTTSQMGSLNVPLDLMPPPVERSK